jgi:RNA polymerase sigma-70 factor, ECF subfamily
MAVAVPGRDVYRGLMNQLDADAGTGLRAPGFAEEALPWLDAVYRFALRLTAGDVAEAEDLAQETFLRAHRHWATFQRGTSARSWLFTITRNTYLRRLERSARRPETPESEIGFDVGAVSAANVFGTGVTLPDREFFDSFIDQEVIRAVEALPRDFREVVVLSDVEGLSYGEIVEVTGLPLGTVKSRLFRGRRQLQKALYEYATLMGYVREGSA